MWVLQQFLLIPTASGCSPRYDRHSFQLSRLRCNRSLRSHQCKTQRNAIPPFYRSNSCQRSVSGFACSYTQEQPTDAQSSRYRWSGWLAVGLLASLLVFLRSNAMPKLLGMQMLPPGISCMGFATLFLGPSLRGLQWRLASASAALQSEGSEKRADKDDRGEGKDHPDQISIESAETEQPAAAAAALTELGNVQTPASVWLPYRDTNTHRNRLRAHVGPAVITIGGRLGRALMQFLRMPSHLLSLLSFKAQQIMLASTGTKLVAIFIAGIPLCVLGGMVYSWASGKMLVDGIISAYGALFKVPGVTVIGEINAMTAHTMNILWLVGTFTFAIVLGVVTEDIVNTVVSIRSGNYPVVATNHTLILNWNSQTISLLRQIAINKLERANGSYDGPVVILADRDKETMDAELRSALKGFSIHWHTRMGSPHCIGDLQRVAAGQARTVILLNPEDEQDVGKKQVTAILGVQSARAMTKPRPFLKLLPQNIAVQVPENAEDRDLIATARDIMMASAQKFKLTYLSCKRDMSTLLALSAIQPGVASVYCTIVQQTQRGVEFYLKPFSELTGKTFGEARRAFDDAVLCGYLREAEGGTTEMHVNCEDSDILQEHDRVIALSQTGRFKPAKRSEKQEKLRRTGQDLAKLELGDLQKQVDPHLAKPKHIVVIWFEEKILDLLQSLSAFAPDRSTVTVVSAAKPEDFPEKGKIGSTTVEFIEGDPVRMELLQLAGVPFSDSIVIGGVVDKRPAKEADALTMAIIMLVQQCLAASGRGINKNPAHIVGMVRKPESVEVANYLMERLGKGGATAELIQPDELVSGIISQVAAEPDMAALFAGFVYSSAGSEIYLRRPWRYHLPEDREISFAQISELCRLRHETAIGHISENGEVRMAPRATSIRKYSSNDRILVIAES